MKKVYQTPKMEMFNMEIEQVVCQSVGISMKDSSITIDNNTTGLQKGANERSSIFSSDGNGYNRSLW